MRVLTRLRAAVTEVDDFGDRWVRDVVVWPCWSGELIERPRVHVCGLWGECRSYGAPPNIAFMGWRHHVMVWLRWPPKVQHERRPRGVEAG